MTECTLGLMIKDGKIFLGEKKRGFAKGVFNGVGGKVEGEETIEECMIREAKEEIGIDIKKEDLEFVALNKFYFKNLEGADCRVHIYFIKFYTGEIVESDEIKPFWFDLTSIPYDKMWEDDIYWLPRFLNGERNMEYDFWFDKDNGKMSKYKLIK